jgi:hypothetical protein
VYVIVANHGLVRNAAVEADLPAVPSLIARWNCAVGSYAEEYEYADLHESYLHQQTILDVAYAVVPYLAPRLSELDADRRLEVLDDIALVEKVRLRPPHEIEAAAEGIERTIGDRDLRDRFIQSTRERNPPLPEDLAPAYLAALEVAKAIAGHDWGLERSNQPGPPRFRRHIRHLRAAGWTNEDLAFGVEVLTRDTDGSQLVYRGHEGSLEGLRGAEDAPSGWHDRTGLHGEGAEQRLVLLALYAVAWLAAGARSRARRSDPEKAPLSAAVNGIAVWFGSYLHSADSIRVRLMVAVPPPWVVRFR